MHKHNDYGILDPVFHGRLIESLDNIMYQTNVQKQFITHSASQWCGPAELLWLSNYRDVNVSRHGLVLIGKRNPLANMSAMAGALIRNYIDCRVQMMHTIMESDPREVTVVAVPNFYLFSSNAGKVAQWESPLILEWLYTRFTAGKKAILAVENMEALKNEYGPAIHDFLTDNYICIGDVA